MSCPGTRQPLACSPGLASRCPGRGENEMQHHNSKRRGAVKSTKPRADERSGGISPCRSSMCSPSRAWTAVRPLRQPSWSAQCRRSCRTAYPAVWCLPGEFSAEAMLCNRRGTLNRRKKRKETMNSRQRRCIESKVGNAEQVAHIASTISFDVLICTYHRRARLGALSPKVQLLAVGTGQQSAFNRGILARHLTNILETPRHAWPTQQARAVRISTGQLLWPQDLCHDLSVAMFETDIAERLSITSPMVGR